MMMMFVCYLCAIGEPRQQRSIAQSSRPSLAFVPTTEPRHIAGTAVATANSSAAAHASISAIRSASQPYFLLATTVGKSTSATIFGGISHQLQPKSVGVIQTAEKPAASRSSYLVVVSSAGNSAGGFPRPKMSDHPGTIESAASGTKNPRSQPSSYLLLAGSAGNSAGISGSGNSGQLQPKLSGNFSELRTAVATQLMCSAVTSVSCSQALLVSTATPYLAMNPISSGRSHVVLQNSNVGSTQSIVTTLILPATPLVRVVTDPSAQFPAIQYVLPANSVPVGNPQPNIPPMRPANFTPTGNFPTNPAGSSKMAVVALSSPGCSATENSRSSSSGNSQSHMLRQSSSSQSLPIGNFQLSSGIVGIPVSMVSSSVPQVMWLSPSASLTATPGQQLQPHLSTCL